MGDLLWIADHTDVPASGVPILLGVAYPGDVAISVEAWLLIGPGCPQSVRPGQHGERVIDALLTLCDRRTR